MRRAGPTCGWGWSWTTSPAWPWGTSGTRSRCSRTGGASRWTPRRLDLLFVESAWHGNGDAWQYHLTGTSAPRPAIVELVQWCRDHGVPTVFWNKEDPVHYADFLDTARLFDHVWTTDSDRVPDYHRDLGHDRVGVLPFAAQQSLHNPIRPG